MLLFHEISLRSHCNVGHGNRRLEVLITSREIVHSLVMQHWICSLITSETLLVARETVRRVAALHVGEP